MSANLTIVDRQLISKALKDMTQAEAELTKIRAKEVAKAVSLSPDFKRLVALQILEEDGLIAEGSVETATRIEAKTADASPSVKSVFAQMSAGRQASSPREKGSQ